MRLQDKVAIVTGAGRGIGKAIALGFAAEGADVALASRTLEEIEQVAADIRAMGRRALAIRADVSVTEDAQTLVDRTTGELGQVDILVNNAGIFVRKTVAEMSEEEWDAVLDVNLKGPFLCSRAVLQHMIPRGSGNIINVSSRLGKVGIPTGGAYCASKFGLEGFTQSLAKEVAESNICVNTLSPGRGVATSMTGHVMHRTDHQWLTPEDMVEPAIFLAMQTVDSMTGSHLDLLEWRETQQQTSHKA